MAGGRGQRNAAVDTKQCTYRRTSGNNRPDLKPTGEPDAVKVARPVRGRVVAKVPQGNSVATYPTVRRLTVSQNSSQREGGEIPRSTPQSTLLTRNEGKPQGDTEPVGNAENSHSRQ